MDYKYDVGDRVTARSADCGDGEQERADGRSGEITEIDYRDDNLPYLVDFDEDYDVWMSEQYLEPEAEPEVHYRRVTDTHNTAHFPVGAIVKVLYSNDEDDYLPYLATTRMALGPVETLEDAVRLWEQGVTAWVGDSMSKPVYATETWVPKFKEGDLIDYRLSSAWNGSVVAEVGSLTPGYVDTYRVEHPELGTGTLTEKQMVPHALAEDDFDQSGTVLIDGRAVPYNKVEQSDDGLSTTFSIGAVPEVKDPAAPTLLELGNLVDLSKFITSVSFGVAEPETVDHPAHYSEGMPEGLEVRDIIKAQGFWKEFCQGNIVKYSLRYQYKNGIEDLRKLRQYTDWLIEELEAEDD